MGILYIIDNPYPIFDKNNYQKIEGQVEAIYSISSYGTNEPWAQPMPELYIVSIFAEKSEVVTVSVVYLDSLSVVINGVETATAGEWKKDGVPLIYQEKDPKKSVALDDMWENLWPGIILCLIGVSMSGFGFLAKKLLDNSDD